MERNNSAAGIALITVLWLIALLTILATTIVTLSVSQRRLAQRYTEAVQADTTLDAAIRVTLLRLITPEDQGRAWPMDQAQSLTLLDETVSVTVQREAGRIDLNTAEPDLLVAVFAANGWRERDARSMAARIVDWRDPDDEVQEGGAENAQYEAAHLSYGPHNGPFESVDELRQVLGSERIQRGLYDSFTVFTHAPVCTETAAAPAVKRALAWADNRRLGGHRWSSENVASAAGRAMPAGFLGAEVLRLTACEGAPHADRCRVAVVRLSGSLTKPFQIFEWRGAPVPSDPLIAQGQ